MCSRETKYLLELKGLTTGIRSTRNNSISILPHSPVPMLSIQTVYLSFQLIILPLVVHAAGNSAISLTQQQEQLLEDRLFQTNLRGPRWTGNDNHNVLTDLVAESMKNAGLEVKTLTYEFTRWDARWWSLSLNLKNGTTLGLPTTGFWPYSGDSGLTGVTGPVHDAGTFGIIDNLDRDPNPKSLNLDGLKKGSVLFFDDPSPTRNYSQPEYHLLGYRFTFIPSLCMAFDMNTMRSGPPEISLRVKYPSWVI
ncbi:hypothetical protein L218DRAFT_654256 [Marasmius fiardii PR-910]|nr:hypothetical protein L218DRAFT_654256 [Marasmius fiardii PR-910]